MDPNTDNTPVEETQAVTTAPEQDNTAAPGPEESAPETKEPEQKPKTFTQEELDAAIGKRLAREQRKWEREHRQAQPQTQQVMPPGALTLEQFESPEAYAEALAEQKANQKLAQRQVQEQRATLEESYREREEKAFEKYDDFEQVAYNPKVPITDVMAETVQASDIGPDIAYWLGSNPKEAARISKMSPFLQAKEIGRIEAQLSANPTVKKTTSAPAPIAPVNAKATTARVVDTTDPKSVETMSTSDWIAAENERERKNLEARYR